MPRDARFLRPAEHGVRRERGALVRDDAFRIAPLGHGRLGFPRDAPARDRGAGKGREALLRHVIHDIEDAQATAADALVVNDIDGPAGIRLRLHQSWGRVPLAIFRPRLRRTVRLRLTTCPAWRSRSFSGRLPKRFRSPASTSSRARWAVSSGHADRGSGFHAGGFLDVLRWWGYSTSIERPRSARYSRSPIVAKTAACEGWPFRAPATACGVPPSSRSQSSCRTGTTASVSSA